MDTPGPHPARAVPQLAGHAEPRGRRFRGLHRTDRRRAGRAAATGPRCSAPRTPPAPAEETTADGRHGAAARRPAHRLPAGGPDLPGRRLGFGPLSRRARRPAGPDRRRLQRPAVPLRRSTPGARSSRWSTTCTVSSGRWSSARGWPGSAGGSSPGWRPASTGAASTSPSPAPPATNWPTLGIDPARVDVVHNGTPDDDPQPRCRAPRSRPWWCSAGWCRTSRSRWRCRRSPPLAEELPGLRLIVAGQGWWEPQLRRTRRRPGHQRPGAIRRVRHRRGEARSCSPRPGWR